MKSRYLFPNQLRLVGWMLAIPGFVLGYFFVLRFVLWKSNHGSHEKGTLAL